MKNADLDRKYPGNDVKISWRSEQALRNGTKIDWQLRVEKAIIEIFGSLDDPLTLEEVAINLYSSPYHFHRMFKDLTGESVKDCLKRLRLERAGELLRTTERSVIEIALVSGFETPEAFSKAFKKSFTISPSYARKLAFWNWELPSRAGIHYAATPARNWFLIFPRGAKMMIKVVNFAPEKFICMKGKGSYWGMPKTWGDFHQSLSKHHYHQYGKMVTSIFFDHNKSEVAWEEKRWAAAMGINPQAVKAELEVVAGMELVETPGGLYAVMLHFGSYEQIGEAWEKWQTEWLPESGWELDRERPSFEWYQNDFNHVPPELLVTLLCDPVTKRKEK